MTSQMFICQEPPHIPSEHYTDADLARFMVRQLLAHEDCRAQLGTVKNHLEINGVLITDNAPAEPNSHPKILGLF